MKRGYKKVRWGQIPNEWDSPNLGEIFTFKNGLNKAKEFFGHGTPIVNYMDVYKHRGLYSTDLVGRVTLDQKEINNYEVRKGDVFFTRTSETAAEVGIASVMLDDSSDTVFSGFVLRARPKDESLVNGFKKYCFSTTEVRRQITSQSSETTRALTNGRSLSSVSIARPSKPEQETIAEALSDADALIESLEKLLAKKNLVKQGAMQGLLTGKKRLPGFTGEWVEKPLGVLAYLYQPKTISAKDLTESGFPVYGANGVVGFYYKTNHDTWQVTVTCRGSTCGTVNRTVDKCWITGNAMVLNCDQNTELNKEFFYHLLTNQDFTDCITGTGQPQIVRTPLASFTVNLPLEKKEQEFISTILGDMDSDITELESKLSKVRQIKQGMMQELLTGRIRLV